MELKPLPSIAFLTTVFLFLLSTIRPDKLPYQQQQLSSFYEVLKSYDLPPGLLSGIKEYKLNDQTGKFKVHLKQKCKFRCGSYRLKYKHKIKGHIGEGELSQLKGIKVKSHKDWERIKRIVRSRLKPDEHNSNNSSSHVIYIHDDDNMNNNNNNSRVHDNDNNSNISQIDTKKHDFVLFMAKEKTFCFPAKRFNRCPTCEHHHHDEHDGDGDGEDDDHNI